MNALAVNVRWMIRGDLPEVMKIERDSFPVPLNEADFLACLSQRNSIGVVAENGDHVVGFMIYELYPRKIVLVRMAVAPANRLRGVATALIKKLFSKLTLNGRQQILIHLRESNTEGHLFLKNQGFRATEVKRRYFEDSGEDAYLFRHLLGEDGVEFNENDSETGELEEIE